MSRRNPEQGKRSKNGYEVVVGVVALAACAVVWLWSGPAAAGQQLLFQVKSSSGPHQVYQFFAITKGPQKRLVGLRYYRKSIVKVGTKSRLAVDPCYPYAFSFAQIRAGVSIFRKSPKPRMSRLFKRLVQRKQSGAVLSSAEQQRYKRDHRRYCGELRTKSRKGRFINSIRGYGVTKSALLDPVKGGHIVVTYLQNGLLNFFRGNYRYVVLKIGKVGGRWRLRTTDGRDASKLFFRAYSLGVSAIGLGLSKGAPAIPSQACHRWIDRSHGSCKLSAVQRSSLPRG